MKNGVCICSVLSLLKGENASETAMFLTKALWEKERKKGLYVPAGIQFEETEGVSMTDLYFSYRKGQALAPFFAKKGPVFAKPFHCFLENAEIEEAQYEAFFLSLAEKVDCLLVSLDGVFASQLYWFLENSNVFTVLIESNKGVPTPQLIGFLHNLRLLWGGTLQEQLKRFLFLLPGSGQTEKAGLQRRLREIGIFSAQEAENMTVITDEDMVRQKVASRKKERGRGLL